MLVFEAIIFASFENITFCRRFKLALLLAESEWGRYFLFGDHFGEFFNSPILSNKSSPIFCCLHAVLIQQKKN